MRSKQIVSIVHWFMIIGAMIILRLQEKQFEARPLIDLSEIEKSMIKRREILVYNPNEQLGAKVAPEVDKSATESELAEAENETRSEEEERLVKLSEENGVIIDQASGSNFEPTGEFEEQFSDEQAADEIGESFVALGEEFYIHRPNFSYLSPDLFNSTDKFTTNNKFFIAMSFKNNTGVQLQQQQGTEMPPPNGTQLAAGQRSNSTGAGQAPNATTSNGTSDQYYDIFDSIPSERRPFCLGQKIPEVGFDWLCLGISLMKLPPRLSPSPSSLRLTNTGIEVLNKQSFEYYKDSLRDFSIENAPKLRVIEKDTFADLLKLRVVYIFRAPKLVTFDGAISGSNPDLTIVRISQTGLRGWPNLSSFKQERILTSFDLDNNIILSLGKEPLNIRTEILNLEFNQLTSIEENTFNNSEIGELSFSGNRYLKFIHPNAFATLKNLVKLDLSHTSVSQLPSVGLHQLRSLIIRDNYALKRIPSIYMLPMLEEAHLTYPYHCCAFKYPQTHDPSAYEEHQRIQMEINERCYHRKPDSSADLPDILSVERVASSSNNNETGPLVASSQQDLASNSLLGSTTTTEASEWEGEWVPKITPVFNTNIIEPLLVVTGPETPTSGPGAGTTNGPPIEQVPAAGSPTTTTATSATGAISNDRPQGGGNQTLHAGASKPSGSSATTGKQQASDSKKEAQVNVTVECGVLVMKTGSFPNITCSPEPDAFNPCEDIMGYKVLRIAVWFVVSASVFGNLSVIVVLTSVINRLSVPKFLQLNLAIGDLFMGIYLALLALADLTTCGIYFNYAIDWQHGYGCKIAGAASLFASQLSIFTLSVITFERYYTITYSIDLNMRLQLGWAVRIMFLGWLYAFSSAMLPIFANINSYSKTSICVPMRTTYLTDRIFIWHLIIIDSLAFLIILICYLRMYLLITSQKTQATAKETTVAMRMALLVLTDFACWAPIIFFGTTAFFGRPLINVTNSKILIVFFYPLNSMANPFLYVISTRQYRRDLNYLTSRWYAWRKNLFKGKNDASFYSANTNHPYGPYGLLNHYHLNNVNAHLGAVAAVTGVANHLKHNHLEINNCCLASGCVGALAKGASDLPAGDRKLLSGLLNHQKSHQHHHHHHHHQHYHQRQRQQQRLQQNQQQQQQRSDSMKLREQKVVCSKSQYVIRHQILPNQIATTKFSRPKSAGPGRRPRTPNNFQANAKLKDLRLPAQAPSQPKLANSNTSEWSGQPTREAKDQNGGNLSSRDSAGNVDLNFGASKPGETEVHSSSSIRSPETGSGCCRLQSTKRRRKLCSTGSECSKSAASLCADSKVCRPECAGRSRSCCPEASDEHCCTRRRRYSRNHGHHHHRHPCRQGGAGPAPSEELASIDILGNISSFNEPTTSSFSGTSSPPPRPLPAEANSDQPRGSRLLELRKPVSCDTLQLREECSIYCRGQRPRCCRCCCCRRPKTKIGHPGDGQLAPFMVPGSGQVDKKVSAANNRTTLSTQTSNESSSVLTSELFKCKSCLSAGEEQSRRRLKSLTSSSLEVSCCKSSQTGFEGDERTETSSNVIIIEDTVDKSGGRAGEAKQANQSERPIESILKQSSHGLDETRLLSQDARFLLFNFPSLASNKRSSSQKSRCKKRVSIVSNHHSG